MHKRRSLWWKIPLALTGVVLGLVLLLLIATAVVVSTPSARHTILTKSIEIVNEKTDWDINLGHLYLSPFHHSPMVLYRAYKGKADLPVEVEIDSLFVGHRGKDTLVNVHTLRLKAKVLTEQNDNPLKNIPPIEVERLFLTQTAFHSDSLIRTVGVDVEVGKLDVSSPRLIIPEGQYPLHGLRLADVFVGIDLRKSTKPTAQVEKKEPDTTKMKLVFDLPDGELKNIHFRLTPLGMDIKTGTLNANALIDVGKNLYDALSIDIGRASFEMGKIYLPFDTIYGGTRCDIDHNIITSAELHAVSKPLGAKADLSAAAFDIDSLRVDVVGDAEYMGSKAHLQGYYCINSEAYNIQADIQRLDLSTLLHDSTPIILAGEVFAEGKGINPQSAKMRSKVNVSLTDAIYNKIDVSGLHLNATLANRQIDGTLHLPFSLQDTTMQVKAQTEHKFSVARFMTPKQMSVDYHAQLHSVGAKIADKSFYADNMNVDFLTDSTTSLDLSTKGLNATLISPMHVLTLLNRIQTFVPAIGDSANIRPIVSLQDLTRIDTIRRYIPAMQADIKFNKGSPLQPLIDSIGLDFKEVNLSFNSDSHRTDLSVDASLTDSSALLHLPAIKATMLVGLTEGQTTASVNATTRLTDGVSTLQDLKVDADLSLDLMRNGRKLNGKGCLKMNDLSYSEMDFGSRKINLSLSPSDRFDNSLRAEVKLDDMPLSLVDSIIRLPDIDLKGAVRAQATIDGLPGNIDISAEVLPLDISAEYKPYQVGLKLGNHPIVMEHNRLNLNGLPIYGADSTFIAFSGGLNLDSMRLNIAIEADSFAPAKLVKDGPMPIYGELATDIKGSVSGKIDSIVADVDVTILPTTDITYPIDKKNLAQVKPHGTVGVRYEVAESNLNLNGQINVDDGVIRYSPRLYPVMPFRVDSGSHITFNGPVGQTLINVSASQKVKADVESEGEETRRVDFNTGVRVNGIVDSIGLHSIGFFLEAPEDETITRELASLDEDTREGLAATLLTTGMYVGESNVAAQRSGYPLSSILSSRINAAMANSKMGKFIEVDISSGQTNHAVGKTNDMNIAISKSFFKDKLRVTVGSTISDNPEVNKANGFLSSLTADTKLTKDGSVQLRLFAQRDYNNILEGELYKSGISVLATKEWKRRRFYKNDSITRTYSLSADAGVAYRSNNSIGPNITLKSSVKNLLSHNEIITIKGNGAYYWALRNRHPGDPKKTDTYKLGVNTSLVFPYLHWKGDNNPDGDTRYLIGYQYENIAGGYGLHKISGALTYFIRSPFNQYIVHSFTPFSLTVVRMKAEATDLLDKAAEYPQLIKLIAGDEFSPAVGYTFTYNDYRAKRAVNTMLELGVKESGNIINALYCTFGHKWNEQDKPLGKITFNQFVKLTAEFRNKFNLTDKICIATRLYAGTNIPLGNSAYAPLSEAFYTGGPNSLRASSPYAYGPGNFYSSKYNHSIFHAGDIKLEANFEFRFPIVWKLFGATFVDAGNVWNWNSLTEQLKQGGFEDYITTLDIPEDFNDGFLHNKNLAKQIALGTGFGLRLDIEGLVIRLDIGVGIHKPYQTYKYDKQGNIDKTRPINSYFNMPSAKDAVRINFGIGYPF